MKNYIICLAVVLAISMSGFAQNMVERTYQSEYLMDFTKLIVKENNYYLGSNNSIGFFTSNKVVKLSSNGDFQWQRNLTTQEASDMIGLYDRGNEIWAINYQITNCDAIFYWRIDLYKYDSSSLLISQDVIMEGYPDGGFSTSALSCELQNGNIIISAYDSLFAIDANGQVAWNKYYPTNGYGERMEAGLNNQFILYTTDAIEVFDSLGNAVNQITNSNDIEFGKTLQPNKYVLISGDKIFLADTSFNILQQEVLTPHISDVNDVLVNYNDGIDIYISGLKAGTPDNAAILRFDTLLNMVDSTEIADTRVKSMRMDGSKLACAGREIFKGCTTPSWGVYGTFFKHFERDLGSTEVNHDGALLEIMVDSTRAQWVGGIPFTYHNIFTKVRARIKNTGNTTIDVANLSYTQFYTFGICMIPHQYERYNVALDPGDETILDFGWIWDQMHIPDTATSIFNHKICLQLSSPEPYLDDNHDNNCLCVTAPVDVGINDPVLVNNLSIFPNPTQDDVNISFELDKETDFSVVIYDISGRQAAHLGNQTYATGKHQVTWDASAYPAGLYYCHITIGEEMVVKKVSVVR